PASRYCLVISSHADGWKNGNSLRASLISDQTSDTKGNPIEIAAWIKGANTQFDGFYRSLDLLVFDACNMASLEVAREFQDTSSFMVFSQAFVPGSGFPYGQILKKIQTTGSSGIDGEKLGRIFCEAYKERYLDGALATAVTVSLLKSSELPAFIGYLQNFFTQVQNNIGKLGPVLASLRDSKTVVAEVASETYVIQSFETSDNRDLHEMLSQCRNSMPEAAIEIDLVHQNFDRLILLNYFSSLGFPKAHGISIGLPDRSAWLSSYISPEKLFYAYYQFAQTTGWDEILAQITQN
ncbi:MAG: clostripain-related cysteine peptidase, partial [Candidatus Riflebacteria bacterium]